MDIPLPPRRHRIPPKIKRNLIAGAILLTVVSFVAALPVVFLYVMTRLDKGMETTPSSAAEAPANDPAPRLPAPALTAFINVNLIPMDSERVLGGQTVITNGELITEIGPADKVKVPAGARRVDGSGKYLLPGLVDMHIHLRNYNEQETAALLKLYVANGVTTVLNLAGAPRHLELRKRAARGELFAPIIYTSGPFISSSPNPPPSPDEIETAIIEQKRAGYDLIKTHGEFTREGYRRLFEVARRENRRVVGHSPRQLGYEVMIEERQDAVAHAEEYIYDQTGSSRNFAALEPKIPALARATAQAGTWLIPNLTAYKNIGLQVADISAVVARPEMRYLPPAIAASWVGSPGTELEFAL